MNEPFPHLDQRANAERLFSAAGCPIRHTLQLGCGVGDGEGWLTVRGILELQFQRPGGFMIAMLGGVGTGKTLMAVSPIRTAAEAGLSARYTRAFDLLRLFRSTPAEALPRELDDLAEVDVLAIDNFECGTAAGWEQSVLFYLLNRRYAALKRTFLVSSQPIEKFAEMVGEGVMERIAETGEVMTFDWPSKRKPWKWRLGAD